MFCFVLFLFLLLFFCQGPEAETLTIGELEDETRLVFVGIGRTSGIAVYKINETMAPGSSPSLTFESMYRAGAVDKPFNTLLEDRNVGNLDPEDLKYEHVYIKNKNVLRNEIKHELNIRFIQ